jgi:type IV pilus assembly protein PilN
MRISLNLASKPYVELRPIFLRLRIAMAVLAALAVILGVTLHSVGAHARTAQAQMDVLVRQTRDAQSERLANEARMHQPVNATVLDRARYLNDLFTRKSFSWTAVMMDLETVLPGGVQVTNIEPQMLTNGELQIRLRVSGNRDRAVELVQNLERSRRFIAPRLASENAQTHEPGQQNAAPTDPNAVEFEILAAYNPLPARERKQPAADTAKDAAKKEAAR